jgi:hypothetical protein
VPRQIVTVFRDYKAAPDECARALELLLRKAVSKAPEPDGRDDYEELAHKERRPA